MKTRAGFVSNSSSSSFIVRAGGAYKTVFDLALHMIKVRDNEWDCADREVGVHRERGDEARVLSAASLCLVNHDTPTAFQTCNSDTFILRSGDRFLVATCHNHDFYNALQDQLPLELTETEMKMLDMNPLYCSHGDVYDTLALDLQYCSAFWWPKHDAVLRMCKSVRGRGPKHGHCKKCQAS
jgi:hypothetical protein